MKIELVNNSTSKCNETAIISVAKFALVESGIHPDSELSIQVVTEEVMSDLHMKWMNLPGPTDVLSFAMDEMKPNSAANGPGIVGDLVLCPSYAQNKGTIKCITTKKRRNVAFCRQKGSQKGIRRNDRKKSG